MLDKASVIRTALPESSAKEGLADEGIAMAVSGLMAKAKHRNPTMLASSPPDTKVRFVSLCLFSRTAKCERDLVCELSSSVAS